MRKPKGRSPAYHRLVAYHEAAHAVLHNYLGVPYRYATVRAHGDSAGHVRNRSEEFIRTLENSDRTEYQKRKVLEPRILVTFAGDHAVKRLRGRRDLWGAGRDRHSAQDYAMILYSPGPVLDAYLRYLWKWSEDLVQGYWPQIRTVAEALLERERLTAKEVGALCRAAVSKQTKGGPDA